jgi:hypothetical protein
MIRSDSSAFVAVPRRADPPAALARLSVHRLRGGSISPQAVQAIAAAITVQEGTNPNDLSVRNNNPGNLIYVGQAGATQGAGGFAAFATPAAGQAALANQITLDAVRGTDATGKPTTTISELISSWAPPDKNDTAAYISSVAIQTGYDVNAPLSSLGAPDSGGTVVASSYSVPSVLDSSAVDTSTGDDSSAVDASGVLSGSFDLSSPVTLAFAGAGLLVAVLLGRLLSR